MQQMIQELGAVIVAGLIFLTLMGIYNRNGETAATQMLNSTVQENSVSATEVISRDFRLIGYGVRDSVRIPWADTLRGIAFKADLADAGTVDSVVYVYSEDHRTLNRSVNGEVPVPVAIGVQEFRLICYDVHGNITHSTSSIATIKVCLMVEGDVKFEGNELYPAVYWERTIRPMNLR
jgi:hypothetical protein